MSALITRLDSFIHHFDTTASHEAEVVVCGACTRATSPAKLIATEAAGHVIAALVLLDTSAAHWAERDIIFVLVCPSRKLAFHCLFARYVFAMPLVATLEANFCAAFRTCHLSCIFVLSSHNFAALRIDTVSDERIRVK